MIATMDMSSYEIERNENETEYDEEILSNGWNPAVNLVSERLEEVLADEQLVVAEKIVAPSTPDDVAAAASEIFLRKMYSYQR